MDLASLHTHEFTEPATIRLVSTAYIDEPAMKPLSDNEADLDVLADIEGLTSSRRSINLPVPGGLDPGELLTEASGYGWTFVNAAFCYTRATGNRFNGPERGAWYATYGPDAVETAQKEVAWHLSRELAATGVFENSTAYREMLAGIVTTAHSLFGCEEIDALSEDPEVAYPAGQKLAKAIYTSGGHGIAYPSSRNSGGKCFVALRPHLVQNIRQGRKWVFEWTGNRIPKVHSLD